MEKVEFRVTADGRVMYRIAGKEEKRLTKFTKDIVEPMTALIHDRFPECYARLATIYRKNVTKMVDRFVRCNFGEEDLLSDDVEHDLLHFEEVRCPLRGICEDERVICKPKTLVNLSNGRSRSSISMATALMTLQSNWARVRAPSRLSCSVRKRSWG